MKIGDLIKLSLVNRFLIVKEIQAKKTAFYMYNPEMKNIMVYWVMNSAISTMKYDVLGNILEGKEEEILKQLEDSNSNRILIDYIEKSMEGEKQIIETLQRVIDLVKF